METLVSPRPIDHPRLRWMMGASVIVSLIAGLCGVGSLVVAGGQASIWEPAWLSGLIALFLFALVVRWTLTLPLAIGIAADSERKIGAWRAARRQVVVQWFWASLVLLPSQILLFLALFDNWPGHYLCGTGSGVFAGTSRMDLPVIWGAIALFVPITLGGWFRGRALRHVIAAFIGKQKPRLGQFCLTSSFVLATASTFLLIFAISIQGPCRLLSPLFWPSLGVAGLLMGARMVPEYLLYREVAASG